jgi:chromosome partitioning protein
LQCEYFALRGFKLLKEITSKIQERLNPDLKIIGIVATMFERTAHSKEVLSRIYEAFPEQVFDTVISKTVRFNETTAAGEPITNYASSSTGAAAYRRLAREVIARGTFSDYICNAVSSSGASSGARGGEQGTKFCPAPS